MLLFILVLCFGSAAYAAPKPGAVFTDCPHCPQMVVVPAGQFVMGSPEGEDASRKPNEGPQRDVTFNRPFAAGRYEVTRGEFARFQAATGRVMPDTCLALTPTTWMKPSSDKSWRDPGFTRAQTDRDPVVCVTWADAQAYAAWLGRQTGKPYRLLSESEWEYAARAGAKGKYVSGEDADQLCQYGNVGDHAAKVLAPQWNMVACDDGQGFSTAPVGSYRPNAFGLYDTHGNAAEWTADCYNDSFVGAPADGSAWLAGDCARHPGRGAAWDDGPDYSRLAHRFGYASDSRLNMLGFRVARGL